VDNYTLMMKKAEEYDMFKKEIKDNFNKAIELVRGAKLYGIEIDVDNLEEVIAALYFLYTYKDYMVKTDGLPKYTKDS